MARVVVDFDDYQGGRMPRVCALSGGPADETLVYRTPVHRWQGGEVTPGRWLRALEELVVAIDVRRSQDLLLGRIPVSSATFRRLQRDRRLSNAAMAAAIVLLLVSVLAAQPLSPLVAGVSAIVTLASWRWRNRIHRRLPRPTLVHAGTKVVLDNVHEDFAVAIVSSSHETS